MNQKMRAFFLMFSCSLLHSLCISQTKNEFQLTVGYRQTSLVDKQASPLLYRSNEKQVGFRYRRHLVNAIIVGELNGSFGDFYPPALRGRQFYESGYNNDGTPKTGSWPLIGTLYYGRLSVGYLQRIHGSAVANIRKAQMSGYAGLLLSNQLFYSDHIVRVGWMNSSFASAVYHAGLTLRHKHQLSATAALAIFARNTRLPYHNSVSSSTDGDNLSTVFKQGSQWVAVNKFQQFQLEAGYDYHLTRKLDIGLHYSGQWLHYTEELPLYLLQNNLSLSVTLKS